ncbi:hypothetical protein AAVH_29915, partial [Aphelenchoides avenae]
MMVPEFRWLFYAFKKIESLNLETSIVPSAAIDNRLLLGLATSGVRKLSLPKFYPTDSEQYVVNLEGISDFLSYAPEGTIELSVRHLSKTHCQGLHVPKIRKTLQRPNCAVRLFVFGHGIQPRFQQYLKDELTTTADVAPPPTKRARTVVGTRLQSDISPLVFRAASQSILRLQLCTENCAHGFRWRELLL